MSRRSENENMIRCRFYGTPGGCAHGQQCHFVHIARQLAPAAPPHLMVQTMPYIHRTLPRQRRRVIGDEYFFTDAERSHMRAERNARIAAQHVERRNQNDDEPPQAAAAEVPDPSVESAPDPVVEASPPPPSAEPARSHASDNRHRRHRRGRHLSRRERSRRRERRRAERRQSERRRSEHNIRRRMSNESRRHRSDNLSSTYAFDAALNILRDIAMNSRPVDTNSDRR